MPGVFQYPGIEVYKQASVTLTPGIQPSTATVLTVPHSPSLARVGTLVIGFGSNFITWRNAAVDMANLNYDTKARLWNVRIMDRRWLWENGEISGRYNRRDPEGQIKKASEKTPRELAELCLEAMNETGYDTSRLPNAARPEVDWDHTTPAVALEELCSELGCVVSLNFLTDAVEIWPLGQGRQLPTAFTIQGGFGIDGKPAPSGLKCLTARTMFQCRLELEAVGKEAFNEELKLIDQLSYRPQDGFSDFTFSNIENEKPYQAAVESVYRWYRVKGPITNFGQSIDLKDVTLFNQLTTKHKVDEGDESDLVPHEIRVWGKYTKEDEEDKQVEYGRVVDELGVSLDTNRKIVRFGQPVYLVDASRNAGPAKLELECAMTLRVDNKWLRKAERRDLPNGGGGLDRILIKDDLEPYHRLTYSDDGSQTGSEDNFQDMQAGCNHYLDATEQEYADTAGEDRLYAGMPLLTPDGYITQVTIDSTEQAFTTRASAGQVHDPYVPSWKEHQRLQQAKRNREFVKSVSHRSGAMRDIIRGIR